MGDANTFEEHEHNLYHLVLYAKQPGVYRQSGRIHQAPPGTLVIISPKERHSFVDVNRPSVYSEITFTFHTEAGDPLTLPFEELLNLYTGIEGELAQHPVLSTSTTQDLTMGMIQIMDYLQSPSPLSDFYAYRALGHVFDLIVTHCYTPQIPDASPVEDQGMLKVRRYIDEHYTDTISAEQLADLVHCSKGHLFKMFKKAFQGSPLAYQQALRFEAAQRLLRFTSLSCYMIAQRVGYDNVNYFHRQFKKRTGQTPLEYRQSIRDQK